MFRSVILYKWFNHLGFLNQSNVLCFCNKLWKEGCLLTSWKDAVIIPILKPEKKTHKSSKLQTKCITSHLGKIMERMIVDRMTFYIEKRRLFCPYQSGFRKGRGTMDSVVCLKTESKKAHIKNESVLV